MRKQQTRRGIALGICLILYHLLVFLIPFEKNGMFWLSYVFTLAAFAVAAGAIYFAFMKDQEIKSRFYNFPVARLGLIYAAVQLTVSVIFAALHEIVPVWLAVLVYAIALGVALLGMISVETALEQVQVQDEKLKRNVAMMRSLQSKVSLLADQSDDPALKKLAEEFRYSDPVSSDALAEIEQNLSGVVYELQAAIIDGDAEASARLCRRASCTLAERNRLCKLNKH